MTPITTTSPEQTVQSAVVQKTHITVSFKDGKVFSADSTQPFFKKLKKALRDKKGHLVRKYINAAEAVQTWSEGKLTVVNGSEVKYDGRIVSQKLHAKLLSLIENKNSVTIFTNFLDNLYLNPDAEAIKDLYDFLEYNDLPLTEDGHFLAFKAVSNNFKDCYTGTLDYTPLTGVPVVMPREECQKDRNITCSTGLHFARKGYITDSGYYGNGQHHKGYRFVVLKINPKNVVSIPTDYYQQKGRACEVLSIAEIVPGQSLQEALTAPMIHTKSAKKGKLIRKPKKSKAAAKKVTTKKTSKKK